MILGSILNICGFWFILSDHKILGMLLLVFGVGMQLREIG